MATSNLQIQIQTVIQGLDQVRQLSQELNKTAQAATAAGQSGQAGGAGFAQVGKGAQGASGQLAQFFEEGKKASEGVNTLIGYLKAAGAAFLAFAAVSSIKGAADLAATNETLANTLEVIGNNAGYSKEQLDKYENEVKSVGITTGVSRETLIQFIKAGIELGPVAGQGASTVSKLAEAAQNLAKSMGGNTSQTLKNLVTNIQQLDTEGLRNQGVIINLEKAYDEFGKTINKTGPALNGQEKQLAATQAVIKTLAPLAGVYGKAIETVGGKIASMKRYQEEAADSIGKNFLPAYKVVVDAATAFLKKVKEISDAVLANGKVAAILEGAFKAAFGFAADLAGRVVASVQLIAPALDDMIGKFQTAFQGIDLSGIGNTVSKVIAFISELFVTLINIAAAVAPSVRLVFEAFSLLGGVVVSAIEEIANLFSGIETGTGAVDVLRASVEGFAFLIAGLADGFNLIKSVAQVAFAVVLGAFAAVINVAGSLVGLLSENLGQAFKDTAKNAEDLANKSTEAARKTIEAFQNGDTATQRLSDSLKKVTEQQKEVGATTVASAEKQKEGYAIAQEAVRQYAEKVRQGNLTGKQAEDQSKALSKVIKDIAETYGLSSKQVDALTSSLNTNKEKAIDTAENYKLLKVSATELKSGMSDAGQAAVTAFDKIVTSGTLTASQMRKLFKDALNLETSLEGLGRFKNELDKRLKDGTISLETFKASVAALGLKFEDLFKKQLSTAKTAEDFADLEKIVTTALKKGEISGAQFARSISQIREAASGAKEEIQRLAEQATALAQENTKLANADLAVTRSVIDVQKSKNALIEAENNNKKEGTDLSKAQLEAARADVALAEEKSRLSVLQKQQESASYDVLIAKQELLNAKKNEELNIGNAEAIARTAAAEANLATQNQTLQSVSQQVEGQRQNVAATQGAADAARLLAEEMQSASDKTAEAAKNAKQLDTHVRDASGALLTINGFSTASFVAELQKVGLTLDEATAKANSLGASFIQNYGNTERLQQIIKAAGDEIKTNEGHAARLTSQYDRMRASVEGTSNSVEAASQHSTAWGAGASKVAEAYAKIRENALSARDAAQSAAVSFLNTVSSIQEELLRAQGKEEEITKSRFEARKRELEIEYQLLQVKLQSAIVVAKASKIDTSSLEKSLSDANAAVDQARKNLSILENLELDKIKKTKDAKEVADAEAKKREEDRIASQAEADKKAAENAATAKNNTDATTSTTQNAASPAKNVAAPPAAPVATLAETVAKTAASNVSAVSPISASTLAAALATPVASAAPTVLQSIARTDGGPTSKFPTPTKVVQIDFSHKGETVSATVQEGYDTKLLELLQRARGVA